MDTYGIAVLGSGPVGRTLAAGLAAAGHRVVVGSRDPGALHGWAEEADVRAASPRDAARDAEIVVVATPGDATVDAVVAAGGDELDGVIVLDVSNPLDFSGGSPGVFTGPDESVGERLQARLPRVRVVKSLCTVNNSVMVDPGSLAEPTTMFVAGDDGEAKRTVSDVLRSLGWRDIVDLGGIEASRQLELNILFWLRMYGAVGGEHFNIKVVRGR